MTPQYTPLLCVLLTLLTDQKGCTRCFVFVLCRLDRPYGLCLWCVQTSDMGW